MSTQSETREFQAETRQLLDLMVHSVYSDKDSFLRELISNASDALDKLRLESLVDKDLDVDTSDLHITLEPSSNDSAERILTIRDNGIGMSRDEVVELIGTLARSGTAELRAKLAQASDSAATEELIGQFGIGFYSTFMVADKVTLVTRKAGEQTGTRWESTGDGTYTITDVDDAPQGTSVTLTLKPADTENHLYDYTDQTKLRALVKRYSDFIAWPIRMDVEKTTTTPAENDGDEPVTTTTTETETINSMKALWSRSRDEVSDEEYKEFYRHVAHAWDDPLEIITLKAEGTFEYQALLFIPSQAPFDLFMRERTGGVQLYVKRVFIMDDCDELMPEYLRFVKGVVDAADLSLNVSREILQQDRQIRAIRRRLTKKVISTVDEMRAARPDDYRTFWDNFGRVFKEGLVNDGDNRDALLKASAFETSHAADELTSLADYVGRMSDAQKSIYYLTGESRQQIENSPHMEAFRAKGIEVLFLHDPVDEMWVSSGVEFDGKPFRSIAKGEVDLDELDGDTSTSDESTDTRNAEFEELLTWLGEALDADISEARLSHRLTESAACLVGDTYSMSPQLERLYRASGQELPKTKRALELNADHPLVVGLNAAFKADTDHSRLTPTAKLIYGMALIAEGGELDDPADFARLLTGTLTASVAPAGGSD
ncbi:MULTISPECIES: molecular chaperone HtpG [unclassified Gordonia (in: high G+C Gram-positive bacteria)]|uniref:molecular chaperone HtpG n=1 Tax=unclassified Gordonia (in: high G+C Gram-positive bacteria) TaxID=2657482 RepID=UPI0007E93015|nr:MULTISPECIES: molecular chaperone HtpG [unclassified Gordonia (in: high G+C Gram-positive bacteria)]OBC02742.1 molecular chaperone HtpG [Gordonia sp. 852002-50395_SCH5434458]OBC06204.1 molecular chaperone HtpG [Gordonia sp. 852002-50816_SCH5313054-a]OBC17372.1 molecular chaperone HtpG [Gordonia sp. 852002-50816_SCH5313054-c]